MKPQPEEPDITDITKDHRTTESHRYRDYSRTARSQHFMVSEVGSDFNSRSSDTNNVLGFNLKSETADR